MLWSVKGLYCIHTAAPIILEALSLHMSSSPKKTGNTRSVNAVECLICMYSMENAVYVCLYVFYKVMLPCVQYIVQSMLWWLNSNIFALYGLPRLFKLSFQQFWLAIYYVESEEIPSYREVMLFFFESWCLSQIGLLSVLDSESYST